METLVDAIDALNEPERGFHFMSRSAPESRISYLALREKVRTLAGKLSTLGMDQGARVVVSVPDQQQFLLLFLAVVRAGLVAVPVPPSGLIGDLSTYRKDIERIRGTCGAACIITSDALYPRLCTPHADRHLISWSHLMAGETSGELGTPDATSPALIQFSSGSTGTPKGIELTHANIISNAQAISHSLAIDPETDRGLSWLPFHHDMGLMGFLITPVLTQTSTWFLPPLEFARQPGRWLELMSQTRATVSYAPNFAYELAARCARKSQCSQWDLSAWRVAGCGGEPVMPAVLQRFVRQFEPAGFRASALTPGFGLAEATVAVTLSRPGKGIVQRQPKAESGTRRHVVSSGRAVSNTRIRIVSPDGREVSETVEGEIQVRGPGVAQRLWDMNGPRALTGQDGWLSTGDRGFLRDGELHVSGRLKETIVINGHNHHAQDVEECVLGVSGIRRGGVVAFGRPGQGSEQLVLVAESRSDKSVRTMQQLLRAAVRQQLGLGVADVLIVKRGTIARTTSGKIRRQALRQCYLAGELTTLSSPSHRCGSAAISCKQGSIRIQTSQGSS